VVLALLAVVGLLRARRTATGLVAPDRPSEAVTA
jgi:hypothetical protein